MSILLLFCDFSGLKMKRDSIYGFLRGWGLKVGRALLEKSLKPENRFRDISPGEKKALF